MAKPRPRFNSCIGQWRSQGRASTRASANGEAKAALQLVHRPTAKPRPRFNSCKTPPPQPLPLPLPLPQPLPQPLPLPLPQAAAAAPAGAGGTFGSIPTPGSSHSGLSASREVTRVHAS